MLFYHIPREGHPSEVFFYTFWHTMSSLFLFVIEKVLTGMAPVKTLSSLSHFVLEKVLTGMASVKTLSSLSLFVIEKVLTGMAPIKTLSSLSLFVIEKVLTGMAPVKTFSITKRERLDIDLSSFSEWITRKRRAEGVVR